MQHCAILIKSTDIMWIPAFDAVTRHCFNCQTNQCKFLCKAVSALSNQLTRGLTPSKSQYSSAKKNVNN